MELTYHVREDLFQALANFLESESIDLLSVPLKSESEIHRHLIYSVLDGFIHRTNFRLQQGNEVKISATRAEAVAIVWLLRSYEGDMLWLKCELHKLLS